MLASPGDCAVAIPSGLTERIAGALDVHWTLLQFTFAVAGVARSCCVDPSANVGGAPAMKRVAVGAVGGLPPQAAANARIGTSGTAYRMVHPLRRKYQPITSRSRDARRP